MLKQFAVSGFKNFQDEFSLDFSNVRPYPFNPQCIAHGLLRSMMIYGRNSSGKTNFGLAIFDLTTHLTNSNILSGHGAGYLNANSAKPFAEFHYVFQFGPDIIDYRYSKNHQQKVVNEKLLLNDTLLLEEDSLEGKRNVEGLSDLAPGLRLSWPLPGNGSLLSYALAHLVLAPEHPIAQMMRFVSAMRWFQALDEHPSVGKDIASGNDIDFVFDPASCAEFAALLHQIGIKEHLTVRTDIGGKSHLYLTSELPLPFLPTASSGAKALYRFFSWYKRAHPLPFLFIDDFDAYYHHELSETILMLLQKMSGTQFILTSHNTNLLSNRLMRPDCYFILTAEKLSSFADATARELRQGHHLGKLYMSGEFDG